MDDDKSVFVYIREYQDDRLFKISNFSNKNTNINLNYNIEKVVISNYDNIKKFDKGIELRPYEAIV